MFSAKSVLLIVALSSICLTTFALDIYMAVQDIRMVVVSEFQTLAPEVTATFSTGAASVYTCTHEWTSIDRDDDR